MSHWRNESGGTLLYVMMCMMVLLIVTPVILSMTGANSAQTTQSMLQKNADQLAISAMEAFRSYLNQVTAADEHIAYFSAYPGWTRNGSTDQPKTYTNPEGQSVTIEFFPYDLAGSSGVPITNLGSTMPSQRYNVRSNVTVKAGTSSRTKSVAFDFTVTSGSGVGGTPPPGAGTSVSTNTLVAPTSYSSSGTSGSNLVLEAGDLPAGQTFESLYEALLPASYNYTVYSLSQLVSTMNALMSSTAGSEFTIQCVCSSMTTDQTYNFLTNNDRSQSKTFVISIVGPSNTTSDFHIGEKFGWTMKGMMLIKGNFYTDHSQSFYDIDNIIANGLFDPSGGSNGTAYIATGTYGQNGQSTTPYLPTPITYTYQAQGYTDPWAPARTQ